MSSGPAEWSAVWAVQHCSNVVVSVVCCRVQSVVYNSQSVVRCCEVHSEDTAMSAPSEIISMLVTCEIEKAVAVSPVTPVCA